ncbi:MAG: hypothetical protein LBQ55_02460 [Treponema sp.]|nr:hypothetical protein [Treponema sp.]
MVLLTAAVLPAAAQDRSGFFAGGLAETTLFSAESLSFGGGLAAGYDGGATALGIRAAAFADPEGIMALEACFFFRLYFPRLGNGGFFLQLNAGPSLYHRDGYDLWAAAVSAGLQAGWRFVFNRRFYLEPALRMGYPYIAGAGLSAGYFF